MNVEKLAFTEDELGLLIEAVVAKLADKHAALRDSMAAGLPFEARDFGIPSLEALKARLETAYDDESGEVS
ncbi:hypothetical protein [Burkholderia gladioli]|uniref:hypothetical protein n=1 Tax=Burkholderia gladioli TaxID=28095 RepID=UPI000D00BA49|nr:hypothetical protein [Burkholderia gladioli]PRG56867.1 hypothetical protein C6V06_04260 [Burkholderia gladioli]